MAVVQVAAWRWYKLPHGAGAFRAAIDRRVLSHTGASALDDQQQVLTTALALLPERVRVTVHGDSEFRSQALYQWLREQDCDAMLGIQGGTLMRHTPTTTAQPLATVVPETGLTYLHGVYLTEA